MKPTEDQIINEPAGRQLDAWAAEIVMGWDLDEDVLHPLFSVDIQAAWILVNRLIKDKNASCFGMNYYKGCYSFGFCNGQTKPKFIDAETASLAITRAAILTKI